MFCLLLFCACFVLCVYVFKNLFALKKSENEMQEYFFSGHPPFLGETYEITKEKVINKEFPLPKVKGK